MKRVVLLFVGTALLAGCGGSSEAEVDAKPAAVKESDEQAAVKDVVTQYMAAILAGDGEAACNLMTAEAVAAVVDDGKAKSADESFQECTDTLDGIGELLEGEERKQFEHPQFTSVEIDGDEAVVGLAYQDGKAPLAFDEEYGWLIAGTLE